MIKKIVKKENLKDCSELRDNLIFWLSKTPQERIAAVEYLRRQRHGSTKRLQRIVRIIQRPWSPTA